MLLYEVPNVIKIFYEKENDLLVHEWIEYNPEDQDHTILTILQKIYDIFLEYPVEKVIVRSALTKGAFSPKIMKYIKEVQFPRLVANTKLRYIATVKPMSEFNEVGMLIWNEPLKKEENLFLQDFKNESQAREWIKTISSITEE